MIEIYQFTVGKSAAKFLDFANIYLDVDIHTMSPGVGDIDSINNEPQTKRHHGV